MATKAEKFVDGNDSVLNLIDYSTHRLSPDLRALVRSCDEYQRERDYLTGKAAFSEQQKSSRPSELQMVREQFLNEIEQEGNQELVDSSLDLLGSVAKEILAENHIKLDPHVIESGIVYLLKIFRACGDGYGDDEKNKCTVTFGTVTSKAMRRANEQVQVIKFAVGRNFSSIVQRILGKDKRKRGDRRRSSADTPPVKVENAGDGSGRERFGKGLPFVTPRVNDTVDLEKYIPKEWKEILKEENATSTEPTPSRAAFSMKINPNKASAATSTATASAATTSSVDAGDDSPEREKLSLEAVIEELSSKFGDSSDEIIQSLFSWLISDRTSESLETDLFDLLGPDSFSLIMGLLQDRSIIVKDYKMLVGAGESRTITADEIRAKCRRKAPKSYGQQIIIQSEQEKRLAKELRKEDKRMNRVMEKRQDGPSSSSSQFVDVDVVRRKELELEAARQTPLFFQRAVYETPKYPYVFDSFSGASKSAAFVAGSKMALPEGHKRSDNVHYEEITIEPSPPPPANIGVQRKLISELDEFIQRAFKNTKSLNLIQSVVLDKAYGSNENLLICAPTGAGKTNIAMLCILNVLKMFTVNGILQKDQFKIVYVALMKALAVEMVRNFGSRLEPFGVKVRELTGDVQMTKQEIMETQMLVTTPEKWDVITRKSTGDTSLSQLVKLLIIDEVHLLHDDRGPVIETLVARTLRQVVVSQAMVRIVGLSATLPNYVDVAKFLRVNPFEGLFFFDGRFRPVPLGLSFVGIKGHNSFEVSESMDKTCFDKVFHFVKNGHQVMVFVHARMATGKTARMLKEMASNKHVSEAFMPDSTPAYGLAQKQMARSRNRQLQELFDAGLGIHHAGMLRHDRLMVERLFSEGHIRVLCCTATLAWGVNLPAHAVIIRGTELYDAKHGSYVDLGMLDVQQIFGRAGRPQFDKVGYGTILTSHDKLGYYLSLLTRQLPIESHFKESLVDNLNAEICLGTVSNVDEAVEWLSFTYLYVRMRLNPLVYGITYKQLQDDPNLMQYRRELIEAAALRLDFNRMIRFNQQNGTFNPIDLGRTASHYYIRSATVEVVNELLKPVLLDDAVLALVSRANEFQELKIREDELKELDDMFAACRLPVVGGVENVDGKVNVLLQAYISQEQVSGFSLISDMAYVTQNAGRILRAVFEMALSQGHANAAASILKMVIAVEKRVWPNDTPLLQMSQILRYSTLEKIKHCRLSLADLKETPARELGDMLRDDGTAVKDAVLKLPALNITVHVQPITRTVLKVTLDIVGDFVWDDRLHGRGNETFHIWVLDQDDSTIHHKEFFSITRRQVTRKEVQKLTFTVPLKEPLPNQYFVQYWSDRWQGSTGIQAIPLSDLILPERHPPHTALQDLTPLPVSALGDALLESLYTFTHYNAVQTQMFFCLYNTDNNVLIGAPTGSGKTIMAELAMFRLFKQQPNAKTVYIAPLKALVQERMKDWRVRLEGMLRKRVVELTGDVTPDIQAIADANVIVTTPEKWDGISRSWQTRGYVRDVSLIVIDEIHLLGEERGPVLEVIVSRTNFITAQTGVKVRVVGLSTALANAKDLADWLNIGQMGLYNFQPSVRPVPLEVHVRGFPEKRYCPRMASMNKPLFQEIKTHSPEKPVLVFVASRKQTRLTGFDLITLLAGANTPKQYLRMSEDETEQIIHRIRDPNLQITVGFGIGMHHAGLHENDRRIVEDLFVNRKIQVLVATATLAWGVNFPAHLVVIKGTEFYDAKLRRYVDMPITDVLQMMGRAGRQQFDDYGVACIFVLDVKKSFYKKFLYEPFPVESNLPAVLADHLNAEIVAGTITSKQAALDYLTWTFFFRRLLYNPSYYHLEGVGEENINQFLSNIVNRNLDTLVQSSCVEIMDDDRTVQPMVLGRIASFYYLQHKTVKLFKESLKPDMSVLDILKILTSVPEYDEIPVRHNEDIINSELAKVFPVPCEGAFDDPHTKAFLLYQAHFSRYSSLNSDFQTDQKSVLDQGIRIMQAMLDVCADAGWLRVSLAVMNLLQMVVQGRWNTDPPLSILPYMEPSYVRYLSDGNRIIETVPELQSACFQDRELLLKLCGNGLLAPSQQDDVYRILSELPIICVSATFRGWWQGNREESRAVIELNGNPGSFNTLHADQQYLLCIDLRRLNRKLESRAYAPKFPKIKDEGWFVVLGDLNCQELVAMKRIGFIKRQTPVNLVFTTPSEIGRRSYQLYLISDCYLGMDQQYDLIIDIIPPSIDAQTNSEMSG